MAENLVLKKWIEPYVLLETLKKHYQMKDYTFDGWTKNEVKKEFFKALEKPCTLGLFMKNVNKFYLFSEVKDLDILQIFGLAETDFSSENSAVEALNLVDMGKAEAAFINVL